MASYITYYFARRPIKIIKQKFNHAEVATYLNKKNICDNVEQINNCVLYGQYFVLFHIILSLSITSWIERTYSTPLLTGILGYLPIILILLGFFVYEGKGKPFFEQIKTDFKTKPGISWIDY